MKSHLFFAYTPPFFLSYFVALLIAGCNSPSTKTDKAETLVQDSVVKDSTVKREQQPERRSYNRYYNDVARYIAGLEPNPDCVLDTALLNNKEWKDYAVTANRNWKKFDSTRIKLLRNWSEEELKQVYEKQETLFYPFSGPDILHAYAFFPKAKKYVLIGLEPVGECPVFNADSVDSLGRYINSINKSLYAILNFSFFRTLSMKADLNNKEVSGVTPLLLIFLERVHTIVRDVRYISLDSKGQPIYETDPEIKKHKGVEITFTTPNDSVDVKQVYYFSVDLSNNGLNKTPEVITYITALSPFTTYLKSASYLMHENYFSTIRTLILEHSSYLLQDDSGIPYRFFSPNNWETILYGSYTGVISLFANKHQKELFEAYQDSTHIKPLPFGIGYKYKKHQSNLMLAKLKQNKQ